MIHVQYLLVDSVISGADAYVIHTRNLSYMIDVTCKDEENTLTNNTRADTFTEITTQIVVFSIIILYIYIYIFFTYSSETSI
jgi:hypothetical protein